MTKMKQEIKERWINALRSGDYKQGSGALRKADNYCCLGVLCDIIKDDINLEWTRQVQDTVYVMDNVPGELPVSVYDYVGLDYPSPSVYYAAEETTLIRLNDTINLSFSQIADLIDKQL
jgi:hypothetical protein